MGAPVTWFDMGAADESPLKTFYSELFGWRLQQTSERYTVATTGGGISGGIGRSQTGSPWLSFYVEVPDLQSTLDRAAALAGSVTVPPTRAPDSVVYAMFHDIDGLLVGLTQALDQAPPPRTPSGSPVDWFEVIGSDAGRSQDFYAELFGWTYAPGDGSYRLVQAGGGGIGGGVGGSGGGPTWATVYAHVDDVAATLARAQQLGGLREYGPNDVNDHMQSGALRDPVGNVMGVYHHEPHADT
jgi:predicted enzyme related to lactoylglutathione lyase